MSEKRREAFERALRDDPYDVATRLVFADFLEEGGHDDEAAEQRRMATGEWCEAHKYLHDLAGKIDLTYDEVALACSQGRLGVGVNFEPDNYFFRHRDEEDRMWDAWEEVSGKKAESRAFPFRCCVFPGDEEGDEEEDWS